MATAAAAAADTERVKYTFVRPNDPFSEALYIHDDYLKQFVNKKRVTPDPKIAGLRLSYQQLRKFTSDRKKKNPGKETMWDGRTVCDFCLGIAFNDMKQKIAKDDAKKRAVVTVTSSDTPSLKRQRVSDQIDDSP